MTNPQTPAHVVAVIGGATAGAEIAGRLSEHGALVVVFDQNPRPYGKIEDGLPRWHVGLRHKEFTNIGTRLSAPSVHFVPNTKIGRDIAFDELARNWGFSAVVLAVGAWRDRPLPVDGADKYLGHGLVYQNPLIVWFNHLHDPAYSGPRFEVSDGTVVVGGGLASIDVMKLLMLETTREALKRRGIDVGHLEDFEQKGIPETLKLHNLTFADLGLKGATLYYRRRIEDMPLAEIPADATPEKRAKVEGSRRKIIDKATEKFCFKVEQLAAPEELIVESDRLAGLKFRRQKVVDGKLVGTDEVIDVRGPCVVSSIGSIAEPIPGLPMKGEFFVFADKQLGRVEGYPNVFSTGNVVTGKGNIVASRKHAVVVSQHLIESFLGLAGDGHVQEAALLDPAMNKASETAKKVDEFLGGQPKKTPQEIEAILEKVRARQQNSGYTGDYASWLKKMPAPPDEAGH